VQVDYGVYVVVQVEQGVWYVCFAPVVRGKRYSEYRAVTQPLADRALAFQGAKELAELQEADWSEAARRALRPETPGYRVLPRPEA